MDVQMKLVYERAWSFHNSTGIDFEELVSVALIAYVKAVQNYDQQSAAKVITFAFRCMTNELIDFCRKKRISYTALPEYLEIPEFGFAHILDIDLNMLQFPTKIREMISIIFENAGKFDLNKPKKSRMVLREILSTKGWSKWQIDKSFSTIKDILSQTAENELFF